MSDLYGLEGQNSKAEGIGCIALVIGLGLILALALIFGRPDKTESRGTVGVPRVGITETK